MKTVFISSVIEGYEEMRQAARRGVELMGLKPITVEVDLAAQVYSPEQACLTAVAQAELEDKEKSLEATTLMVSHRLLTVVQGLATQGTFSYV